ncbi:hypothetical protein FA13DRAFT_1817796 [Coprinellus micaceus]|uniref:F-box domain-containing protein n=1 Tax=Coprinellus micaceus TaxID=71717 RepID=A0A4Y7SSD8_COPMI|nr:hypothetical protein FA13DRAFT_1817796 [Coprinellus micaceus]
MSFDSPFTRYVDTNYAPLPDKIRTIKVLIEEHRAALHNLLRGDCSLEDGTKSTLDTTLVATDQAIRSHQDFIRLHLAPLSPARVVPLDVLAIIFTFYLDIYEESRRSTAFKTANPRHPIVSVTHVCHEWRELAVGIPSLWRYIHIDSFPRPRYNGHPIDRIRKIMSFHRSMDMITERVTVFLSRAAPLPIVLSCAGADPHPQEDLNFQNAAAPLINVLRTAKWEDVSFNIDIKANTLPLVRLLPIPVASVATIRSVRAHELKGVWGLQRVFPGGRPPLQHLQVLVLDCSGEQLLNTRPHCERLTHLSIGPARKNSGDVHSAGLVAHEALNILQVFPNLQECELRFSATYNYLSWSDLHSVTLPFLSFLSLGGTPPEAFLGSKLIVPSLRRLPAEYFYTVGVPQHASDNATALIIREYGSQLTEVTLGYGHLPPSALTSCLRLEHLKNVTSLTLSPAQTDRDHSVARLVREHRWNPASSFLHRVFLERLMPKPRSKDSTLTESCLCPNLESISYEIGSEDDTLDAWMDLIVARRSNLRASELRTCRRQPYLSPPALA